MASEDGEAIAMSRFDGHDTSSEAEENPQEDHNDETCLQND